MSIVLIWFIGFAYDFIATSAASKNNNLKDALIEKGLENHLESAKIVYFIISIVGSCFWFMFMLVELYKNIKILITK